MICYDKYQIQDRYYLWEGSAGAFGEGTQGLQLYQQFYFLKLTDTYIGLYSLCVFCVPEISHDKKNILTNQSSYIKLNSA